MKTLLLSLTFCMTVGHAFGMNETTNARSHLTKGTIALLAVLYAEYHDLKNAKHLYDYLNNEGALYDSHVAACACWSGALATFSFFSARYAYRQLRKAYTMTYQDEKNENS